MSRKIANGGTFYPGRLHKVICCDCGLVHLMKFDTKKRPKNKPLMVTVWRLDDATRSRRRSKKLRAYLRSISR